MENSKKTQLLTLSLIATLLSLTPLLSSSFRSTYLYFIINVLIIILGVEAGFLSSSSSSSSSSSPNNGLDALEGDKKNYTSYTSSNFIVNTTKTTCLSLKTVVENSIPLKKIIVCADEVKNSLKTVVENSIPPVKKIIVCADEVKNSLKTVVENSIPVKKIIVCADEVKKLIKKCPSRPSLFFIDGDESEAESEAEEEVVYEEEEELFVKAEKFIGNFYQQLKMQREESWNKIHGFHNNGLLVN